MSREIGLFGILRERCKEEVKNAERSRDVLCARRTKHSPCNSIGWIFGEIAEHMKNLCKPLEARRQGGRPSVYLLSFLCFVSLGFSVSIQGELVEFW